MMTSPTGKPASKGQPGTRGFTLIELILVMALLLITISVVMPAVSRFFGGRKSDSEVKQIVSLMQYGRSRAVSEGAPMMLWVDTGNGKYGLKEQTGYTDNDTNALDFTVADGLKVDVDKSIVTQLPANSQTGRILSGQVSQAKNQQPAIYFMPDGTINSALSIRGISVQDGAGAPVWIIASSNQVNYAVQSQQEHLAASRH
jgi:prepilin-type N-terminal cleavage/methylation domain-containing protein